MAQATMSPSSEYVHLFVSGAENGADALRNPRVARIAKVKSVLLIVAIIVAFLACVASVLLCVKVVFLHNELSEMKAHSTQGLSQPFLIKTRRTLEKPVNGTKGHTIWCKTSDTDKCLDVANKDGSQFIYAEPKVTGSRTQQWRMIDGMLFNGESKRPRKGKRQEEWCAQCSKSEPACDLKVELCDEEENDQQFLIAINFNQIDFSKKRVYFSIRSDVDPTLCAGVYHYKSHGPADYVHLETCTDADNQLFFLSDVDYKDLFAKLNEKYRQMLRQ